MADCVLTDMQGRDVVSAWREMLLLFGGRAGLQGKQHRTAHCRQSPAGDKGAEQRP